jgi:hypothetical protein
MTKKIDKNKSNSVPVQIDDEFNTKANLDEKQSLGDDLNYNTKPNLDEKQSLDDDLNYNTAPETRQKPISNDEKDFNAQFKLDQEQDQQKEDDLIKTELNTEFNLKSETDSTIVYDSKEAPDLSNKTINIKIDGVFPLTGHTLEIYGFAAEGKEFYLHPFITDAYLIIRDKQNKIIRTLLGSLDGLNSVHKPIIFSIKCDPETNHTLDSIGLMVLYNKRGKFNGKMYQLNESKVLALAHKQDSFKAGQIETIHQTRNKRYIPFEASIDVSQTTIIAPDYDKTAINIETLTQVLKAQ